MQSSGLMKYICSAASVWMQSTGQTSTQEASLTPMQGSVITKGISPFPPVRRRPRPLIAVLPGAAVPPPSAKAIFNNINYFVK